MQKVLAFLEKHVQWVAIGLGAVYLLWMVYSYVLNSPSRVTIGDSTLSPGQVDEYVKRNFADPLGDAMNNGRVPTVPAAPTAESVLMLMNQSPSSTAPTAIVFDSTAIDVPLPNPDSIKSTPVGLPGPGNRRIAKMSDLPKLPPVSDINLVFGRSNADLSVPTPLTGDQPPADNPPPADPNAQPVAEVVGTDINWITVSFKVSRQALADEFKRCNVPDGLSTEFLKVELVRQELLGDGQNWGDEKVIPALSISTAPAYPAGKNKAEVGVYLSWADQNQVEILQPGFYNVLRGDTWRLPGEEGGTIAGADAPSNLGPNDVRQGFDPANPPDDMTNAEKRLVYKYQQEQKKKEAKPRDRNSSPSGSKGGRGPQGGGGGPAFGPGDTGTPNRQPRGAAGRNEGNAGPGAAGGDDVGIPPEFRPGDHYPGQGAAGQGVPQIPGMPAQPAVKPTYPMPPGPFDPRQYKDEIVGWAHDTSVEAGKTYRYFVRYKMRNPAYGLSGNVENKALADGFDMVSPNSSMTEQVTVPNPTAYFLAGVNLNSNTARFDVFRWQNGQLHKKTYTVSPGDMIGKPEDGIDFTTGTTVVDVLRTGAESAVLIVDAGGNLRKREQNADQRDPELTKLQAQVSSAGSTGTSIAGTR